MHASPPPMLSEAGAERAAAQRTAVEAAACAPVAGSLSRSARPAAPSHCRRRAAAASLHPRTAAPSAPPLPVQPLRAAAPRVAVEQPCGGRH